MALKFFYFYKKVGSSALKWKILYWVFAFTDIWVLRFLQRYKICSEVVKDISPLKNNTATCHFFSQFLYREILHQFLFREMGHRGGLRSVITRAPLNGAKLFLSSVFSVCHWKILYCVLYVNGYLGMKV